ncbi:MAG: hypothetical protein ACRDS9_10820 [Pseudonocardiaceae bacterium]
MGFSPTAELVSGVIWIYDFTHFRASHRCAVAVLDVVSRRWLSTVVSARESSTPGRGGFGECGDHRTQDRYTICGILHGRQARPEHDRCSPGDILGTTLDATPPPLDQAYHSELPKPAPSVGPLRHPTLPNSLVHRLNVYPFRD